MDSARFIPMFVFGGFGIGGMIVGQWKAASFNLLFSFIFATFNRFLDIWREVKNDCR